MKRADGEMGETADRDLWRRSGMTETTRDEAAHLLDLAAFAEDRLDPEDRDRVAALLAADPEAAADVAAASSLAAQGDETPPGLDRMIARAAALVPERAGLVIALPRPIRHRMLPGLAQWGSLAAAIAVASWFGFAMGSDAWQSMTEPTPASGDGLFNEFLDPPVGILRDLGEGQHT